jgi:exportin-5
MNGIEAQQNGHAHSAVASSNGVSEASADNAQILRALELIHDPRSKNEHRHEASQYLEQVKAQETAPYTGYLFASERGNPAVVRHFGLSLLETAIKHRWTDYQEEQSTAVREWVVKLAQNVEHADPLFVRNKVAQLWVEVAKRSWALDWLNMDEQLVELWAGPVAKKVLVLDVLETLSENSFGKEDTVTALRGSDLSKACVDIFVPGQVLAEHFPKRDTANLRFGEEGWLWRLSTFLGWCNEQSASDTDVALCAGKALDALKSVVAWITLLAVASTNTVQHVCRSLTFADHEIQLVRTPRLRRII